MRVDVILQDYEKSLESLFNALAEPAANDVYRAGCIQYFEFSFELAWKSIKTVGEDQGLDECNSPKKCLRLAFTNKWITDEEIWLEMLLARNRMSHTYNASQALKIYDQLSEFLQPLKDLLPALKREVE